MELEFSEPYTPQMAEGREQTGSHKQAAPLHRRESGSEGCALPISTRLRVAVLGGSLIGLTTALILRDIGCDVDVYERSSTPLEGRGVGIVLHPLSLKYLLENSQFDVRRASTSAAVHRYVDVHGSVVFEAERRHYFTAYNTLYRALLDEFGSERYHLAHEITGILQIESSVTFAFAAGGTGTCDLLVGADGISSTARRLALPKVRSRYAGYVAWRAVVGESELTTSTRAILDNSLTYYVHPGGHALIYPIPNYDGSVETGHRLMNLVWYRNVAAGVPLDQLLTDRHGRRRGVSLPPGAVRPEYVDELRIAARGSFRQRLPR